MLRIGAPGESGVSVVLSAETVVFEYALGGNGGDRNALRKAFFRGHPTLREPPIFLKWK